VGSFLDPQEPVRKGLRFPNLPSPYPSGESPAEGAEGAVSFSTCLSGWVGFILCPRLSLPPTFFWGRHLQKRDPMKLHFLSVLCVLCGSPPHPVPEPFRCGSRGFRTGCIK
jgi:hypothetical protein